MLASSMGLGMGLIADEKLRTLLTICGTKLSSPIWLHPSKKLAVAIDVVFRAVFRIPEYSHINLHFFELKRV